MAEEPGRYEQPSGTKSSTVASSTIPDDEDEPDGPDEALSEGARRILGMALTLHDAGGREGDVTPTETLLGALVNASDGSSHGSSQALFSSLPDPQIDRLGAALAAAGTTADAATPAALDARAQPMVVAATRIAAQTGSAQVHSRHVLTAAIVGGIDAPVLSGLQCTAAALRSSMLEYLRRRWPDESPAQWEELLTEPPPSGRTPLLHDQPAIVDRLGREPLAEELAQLVRQLSAEPSGPEAFALHLDGPWGAGKTTVAHFVGKKLRRPASKAENDPDDWIVVELDAWRSSQLSPAWWALLTHLRRGVRSSKGFWDRRLFDLRRFGREARRLWRIWVPIVIVIAALFVVWMIRADVDATMAAITTVVAFIAAIGGLGTRIFSLGSIQGARLHERLNDNPMDEVAERIRWIRARAGRPILLVLDDLDRCNQEFAVQLLDAVQTLLRTPSKPTWRSKPSKPSTTRPTSSDDSPVDGRNGPKRLPVMVVLAVGDRRWLRAAYEHEYATFSPYVSEPGRPLGHLFLDKLFQVRIELPQLSQQRVDRYLASLLSVTDHEVDRSATSEALVAEMGDLAQRAAAKGHSVDHEMTELLATADSRSLTPAQYERVARAGLEARRADPLREQREEHLLTQYASLLERNPRATKRFVMAYNLAFVSRIADPERADPDTLALWTVVETRWPDLAEWVRRQLPDGSLQPTGDADHPSQLLLDREVRRVVTSPHGGPLDRDRLLRCLGHPVGPSG